MKDKLQTLQSIDKKLDSIFSILSGQSILLLAIAQKNLSLESCKKIGNDIEKKRTEYNKNNERNG